MVSTFPKPWMDNRVAIRHIHWKIGRKRGTADGADSHGLSGKCHITSTKATAEVTGAALT